MGLSTRSASVGSPAPLLPLFKVRAFVAQRRGLPVAGMHDRIVAVHVKDPRRDVSEQRLEPRSVVVGVSHAPGEKGIARDSAGVDEVTESEARAIAPTAFAPVAPASRYFTSDNHAPPK